MSSASGTFAGSPSWSYRVLALGAVPRSAGRSAPHDPAPVVREPLADLEAPRRSRADAGADPDHDPAGTAARPPPPPGTQIAYVDTRRPHLHGRAGHGADQAGPRRRPPGARPQARGRRDSRRSSGASGSSSSRATTITRPTGATADRRSTSRRCSRRRPALDPGLMTPALGGRSVEDDGLANGLAAGASRSKPSLISSRVSVWVSRRSTSSRPWRCSSMKRGRSRRGTLEPR